MNKKGSALIFVSLLMAFVGIIAILFTRSSMLYYGFAIDRIHHIRSQYALDALAQYGVAQAISSQKASNEKFEKWPFPDGPYQGKLKIVKAKDCSRIYCELFQCGVSLGKVSCVVHASSGQKGYIDEWSYL